RPSGAALRPAFCFQAEDGIRDFHVTGVQTCALPISAADGDEVFERSARWNSLSKTSSPSAAGSGSAVTNTACTSTTSPTTCPSRSEERPVGTEQGARRAPWHDNADNARRPRRRGSYG